MSFGEYTISYKSVSVPSIPGENEIDLFLESRDDRWVLTRSLGSMYDKDSSELDIPKSEATNFIEKLTGLKLPAVPEGIVGLDGTTHTLQISNGLNSITYEWWVGLPQNLADLKAILEQLFTLADLDIDIQELDIDEE